MPHTLVRDRCCKVLFLPVRAGSGFFSVSLACETTSDPLMVAILLATVVLLVVRKLDSVWSSSERLRWIRSCFVLFGARVLSNGVIAML